MAKLNGKDPYEFASSKLLPFYEEKSKLVTSKRWTPPTMDEMEPLFKAYPGLLEKIPLWVKDPDRRIDYFPRTKVKDASTSTDDLDGWILAENSAPIRAPPLAFTTTSTQTIESESAMHESIQKAWKQLDEILARAREHVAQNKTRRLLPRSNALMAIALNGFSQKVESETGPDSVSSDAESVASSGAFANGADDGSQTSIESENESGNADWP